MVKAALHVTQVSWKVKFKCQFCLSCLSKKTKNWVAYIAIPPVAI